MNFLSKVKKGALGAVCLSALAACDGLDLDMRSGAGQLDTSEAARQATAPAPTPDERGVISYPGYQVALARRDETVAAIAMRLGLEAQTLATYNALPLDVPLREGAVVALPRRVGEPGSGAILGTGTVDVATIAGAAIERADGGPGLPSGNQPVRHRVQPGETAFSIARTYGVPVAALAEWNGLGSDLALRDGQFLLIPTRPAPVASAPASDVQVATIAPIAAPGVGSVTPLPPSASAPLPRTEAAAAPRPAEPDPEPVIEEEQTAASDTSRLTMPVQGSIIRPFGGDSDGIVISAPAGSDVSAADAGTVAQITEDTGDMQIIVVRHEGGLLTVYAGVDNISVSRGDRVGRGQKMAEIQDADPSILMFEVREGFEATDPEQFFR